MNYSIGPRINPQERDASPKYYAFAQCDKTLTLNDFARHIATHGCVYSRADVTAILTMAVDCLREMLLHGYKVELGDLGNFFITLSSEGALTAAEFNPAIHMKSVNVNWERGPEFVNLLGDAVFTEVSARSVQKAVLRAVKNGETVIDLGGDSTESDESVA